MIGEVNRRRIPFLSFANVEMFNYKRRRAKGTRGPQRSSCCPTDDSSYLLKLKLTDAILFLALQTWECSIIREGPEAHEGHSQFYIKLVQYTINAL
ncbi:hypothetical protein QL285_043787 [Trifolium repens]|nr:hypothetical protein QL285_043787 [Trifolium repens]